MKELTPVFLITFTLVGLSPARVVAFGADTISGSTGNEPTADGVRYEYAGGWGRPNPPEMVQYIMDLAVGPDGNVYLLYDGGDNREYVQVFTPAGASVRFFGGAEQGLGGGTSRGAIAVGPDGSVCVVGFVAEGVTKFFPGRKFPQVWKWFKPYFHIFDDVAVGRDGLVYAADGGDTIERFTAEGERLDRWELEKRPPGEGRPVDSIRGIDVGPEGRIFVADDGARHLLCYKADGAWAGEITWDKSVVGPAVDVAVAPDGTVYVTDGYNLAAIEEDGSVVAAWPVIERRDDRPQWLRGLAAGRDGNVYVGVCNVVKCFTREGVPAGEIDATSPPPGYFNYPCGIAVSPEGVVYVADNYNDRIAYFTADGGPLGSWGRRTLPLGDDIDDVAWCADGTVAVLFGKRSESMRAYVGFYGPNGEFLYEWPVIMDSERRHAHDLAAAVDGTVYVATNGGAPKVLRFTSDGAYLGAFDVEVEPSIYDGGYVAGLAVGPAGTVYVIRSDYYGLLVYSADGKLREERYVEELREDDGAEAVAVGLKGHVFLASKSYIYRFNADGELVERWGGSGEDSGRFDDVSAMAVAANGTVYVVDSWLKRVQYFRPVGREE